MFYLCHYAEKLLAAQGVDDSPFPSDSDSDDELATATDKVRCSSVHSLYLIFYHCIICRCLQVFRKSHSEPVYYDSDYHQPLPKLSPTLHPSRKKASEKSALQYAKYLRAFYQSRALPLDTKWPPTPSKRYINLAVVQREPANREEAYKLTTARFLGSIDEILKYKKPVTLETFLQADVNEKLKCILVEGGPGVGKSTFSWEICRQWQELEALKRFTLVILIQLRDKCTHDAVSLTDILYHRDKSLQKAVVEWIEDQDGAGTLFVLDGFDELPSHQRVSNSIFTDLIHGIYLPKSVVVVTSRPSATAEFLHNYKPLISRHAEILGFTQDNIETYAKSIFGDSTEIFSQFMNYVSTNPLIYSMMYIPLNAVIVTEVFKESLSTERSVPRTMTQLYNILSLTLLRRHMRTEDPNSAVMPSSLSDLPSTTESKFKRVIEEAFQGICAQKLTFCNLPLDFHHLGFMTKVTSLYIDEGTDVSFNFLHLTLQEFLAAYHISLLSSEEQQKLYRRHAKESHFEVVWRFVAGLTTFSGITLHKFLIQSCREAVCFHDLLDAEYCLSSFGLRCLFEAQNSQACSAVCGMGKIGYQPTSAHPFDSYALGYCIANSNASWSLAFPNKEMSAESLSMLVLGLQTERTGSCQIQAMVIGVPLTGVKNVGIAGIRSLAQIPADMVQSLDRLELGDCSLDATACAYLANNTPLLLGLKVLHLEDNPLGNGGATDLFRALIQCGSLHTLSICSCNLGGNDIHSLKELLKCSCSLCKLTIGDSDMSMECVQVLLTTVLGQTSLTKLSLVDVQLDSVTHHLSQLIAVNTNLVELWFSYCSASVHVVSGISRAMLQNKTIRKLGIRKCSGVNETATSALIRIVEGNNSLEELHVGEKIEVSGCIQLIQALSNNTMLRTLKLLQDYKIVKTSFSSEELASVVQRISWTL